MWFSPPHLCGAIPADDKYKCKENDQVAARVKTDDGEEEQWILAVVVNYNSHYHRYTVDDIDEEGHNDKKYGHTHSLYKPHPLVCYCIAEDIQLVNGE